MPICEKRVKLHKEKRPIFSRFQLEEQIDQIYEKRVPLPSGGSLIIEPTEALVSIDVNSGKSSGERGIEDTAFKANMEAAEEVARQLRLRDLGGLIVIDFIDMRDKKHNHDVEKTLKNALKMDKARVNLGRISEFGIMEMSRQRIAKTLNDAIHLECPHCEGRGKVKSVEAMAVSFLRKVHAAAAKGTVAEIRGGLPLEVAYYLLNRKKRELTQIENDYEIEVTVKGKTSFLLNQLELETIKREKPHLEDVQKSAAEAEEAHKPVESVSSTPLIATDEEQKDDISVPSEGVKKRKRRKKKKKTIDVPQLNNDIAIQNEEVAYHANDQKTEELIEATELTEDSLIANEVNVSEASDNSADQSVKPKKRKRRRSRSKAHKVQETTTEEVTTEPIEEPVITSETPEAAVNIPEPQNVTVDEIKPKRVRSSRKKRPEAVTETPVTPEPAVEIITISEPPPAPKKPRRTATKKNIAVATDTSDELPPIAVETTKENKRAVKPKRQKKPLETP
jgi:ribonuclease E